jgi:hypothetical protein
LVSDSLRVPLGANLPATTSDADRSASGSSLLVYETGAGAIHGSLRYVRVRRGRLQFALDVVNALDEPLLATVYARSNRGEEVPLEPYAIWIDARTEAYVDLPVGWLAATTCSSISVRLQGRSFHQRLDAAMPRPKSAGWFAAGVLLTLGLAALAFAAVPRITALSIPATALAGAPLDMRYASSGIAARSWELDDLRGGRIDGGTLASANASAKISAPRPSSQTAYTLRVIAAGPFGSASAERPIIVTTPVPAMPLPRIISLDLDNAAVPDGASVTVRYRMDADHGDVLATDAQGTIWAEAPANAKGVTTLQLPRFNANKELQVRLVVRRGTELAFAGVGLQVLAPAR